MGVEVYLTLWVWKCTSLYGCGSVPHSMGVEVYLTLWVWKCTSLYVCGWVYMCVLVQSIPSLEKYIVEVIG